MGAGDGSDVTGSPKPERVTRRVIPSVSSVIRYQNTIRFHSCHRFGESRCEIRRRRLAFLLVEAHRYGDSGSPRFRPVVFDN